MAHERIKPSFVFDEDKIKQLKQIVPECFEDGKINFETLRQNLGDWAQDEEDQTLEHFGLFWPGKQEARRMATTPPEGTLEPVYGQGLKADGTPDSDGHNDSKNIFIEGENLEVLKILQKSYAGKIKMIYIDPPYNTGNDFIYNDDFTESISEYLSRTGQVDGEGKLLTTNKRTDGRFHSKWLSMMYPRLRLARNLLKENGVIFISIDENEINNLKNLMIEIFGEENFIATIIWQKVFSPKNTAMFFSEDHEYIVVFAKSKNNWIPQLMPRSEETIKRYKNPDNDERGPWMSGAFQARNYYSKGQYIVSSPTGKKHENPKGTYWRVSEDKFKKLDLDNRVWWGEDGNNVPRIKRFLTEVKQGVVSQTLWKFKEVGHTQEAKEELLKYVTFENTENVLNSVKPTRLIDRVLHVGSDDEEECIILDFFAGSCPTAISVFKRNIEKNLKHKFLLVQFPESLPIPEKNLTNIGDLGKSRITNFIKEIDNSNNELDLGFKAFKLSSSNYSSWTNLNDKSLISLQKNIDLFTKNPLVSDWNKNKLLTELKLIEGFPLDATQENLNIDSNEIVKIESEMVTNNLLICLDEKIEKSLIKKLELDSNTTFICFDAAISTQDKLQLSDRGLIKTI